MGSEDAERDNSKQSSSPYRAYEEKEEDPNQSPIFLFGLVGATAAALALARSQSLRKGGSFQTPLHEKAWRWYNRRMLEKYDEEMETAERIRKMQSVFRERNKYKSYTSWRENGPDAYHPLFQHDDWYWRVDTLYGGWRANYWQPRRDGTAFRAKVKQFHPDQNRDNKEVAEAKFKEVMISYKAIMQERKITWV